MSDLMFSAGPIVISRTIAKFGDTSYPIANIGAVSIELATHPLVIGGWVLCAVALFQMFSGSFWFGLLLIAVGAALIWHFADKGKAKLMLRTSSGNQQAFESPDRALVQKLKSSIEEAIASRG
ncbi:DUF6232 family protein [Tabrizicola caldifontis]|uniref:DUF6232 family protein n=1 Tax=Tabrizicola caldifontis TaxID=2528036 RepID=UPI001081B97A|nr:DUF6232 family protein [Rhodobacter sp. YIM 73028]